MIRSARPAVILLLAVTGCSNGCQSPFQPLPAPLPRTQIVEGGVQVRVTRSGLGRVTQALLAVVEQEFLAGGVCIPAIVKYDPGALLPYIDVCNVTNQCAGGARGCRADLGINSATLAPVDGTTLRADVNFNADAAVPVHAYYTSFLGDVGTCTLVGSVRNAHVIADIVLGIDGATGNITLHLGHVDTLDIQPDISSPDCGVLADIIDVVAGLAFDLFSTSIGNLIVNLITPTLDGLIQGALPNPLGLDGLLDIGSFLSTLVPGASAKIEVHGVPGGYAGLPAGGISVGVNVGLNADRDPTTRGATDSSQPALCVPQWQAPDLSAPPASLQKTARGTFTLPAVADFQGGPDPASDIAIGVSQTVLDLAGHHVVSAGALCLTLGSTLTPQLNLGTVGILVPSLAALGKGAEPIQLVLRPTAPITFDIGDGTTTSPYLTAHLRDLEIDFYALLFERYVRAFTVAASVDLGINLVFMLDKDHQAVIVPALVGLDASKIKVTVSNTELLRESPQQLQTVFPTLISLVLPLLSSALPDFPVPSFDGFILGDLKLGHVKATQDDFLAIYASLAMASQKPTAFRGLPERATTTARVVRVTAPALEELRAGELPEVELELGGTAPGGDALEWQWNLDGGMWRPFAASDHLVISDPALALEGRHGIQVRARAVDRYQTTDVDGVEVAVVIDSIAPRVFPDTLRRDGDAVVVEAHDLVTAEDALGYALGRPDAATPAAGYAASAGRLSLRDLAAVADAHGRVKLFVRDESGNVATTVLDVAPFVGIAEAVAPAAGCAVGGGGSGGALVVIVLAVGLSRRRLGLALALLSACSGAKLGALPPAPACKIDGDCASACKPGEVGSCSTDGTCACAAELSVGAIGTYTNLAATPTGTAYLSAYNALYGDLMVAQVSASGRVADDTWEFVDGVPAGPVEVKGSKVRGGIREPGDDVGWYTSIAVTPAGDPVVAYYDATHASLRFAQKLDGHWTSYTVDAGVPMAKDVGKYTAITVDGSGRPGIAYLAMIADGTNGHSEVRFAQASRAQPAAQSDWTEVVLESKAIPTPTATDAMLDDLPNVCGLFVAAARTPAGLPVIAYYDRPAGELKLALSDGATFKTPVVVDGGSAPGDNVGWYPSLAVSPDGAIHIAYIDASADQHILLGLDYPGGAPFVIDDGYRTDGTTSAGMPRPVYHKVGDNSAIVNDGKVRAVVYQDATTQDLMLATPGLLGLWGRTKIAGSDVPYKGAYGFYAAGGLTSDDNLFMASYVIDQATKDQWVEVFKQKLNPPPVIVVPGG